MRLLPMLAIGVIAGVAAYSQRKFLGTIPQKLSEVLDDFTGADAAKKTSGHKRV